MSSRTRPPPRNPKVGCPCSATPSLHRGGRDHRLQPIRNVARIPRRGSHEMSSKRTLLRATAVAGKSDAAQARPAHNTKSEDQLMARLAGKVAVITGGSSGIGLATAQRFADEGASVYIVGRRQSELNKAKALIGDGLSTVAADVTIGTDLDRLFATVLEEEGGLDILVVNSGRGEPEELGKITEENFDATFDLNARATLFTVQKGLAVDPHR